MRARACVVCMCVRACVRVCVFAAVHRQTGPGSGGGYLEAAQRQDIAKWTVSIFEFLHDKDLFHRAYTTTLQHRLLASRDV